MVATKMLASLKASSVAPLNGNSSGPSMYDPAFTGNRTAPLHRWAPWIAGYSAKFVEDALDKYHGSASQSRVLDPFAGVGTTLVEARFRGCDSVGFEINPWPALVARTKLAAGSDLRSEDLLKEIERFNRFVLSRPSPASGPPDGFLSRIPFYSSRVEPKVLITLDFMRSIENPWVRDAFRVAFGASMVSFSNYTYEPSLGSRPGAGKPLIEDADVAGALSSRLTQMAQDVAEIEREGRLPDRERTVHVGSFLDYDRYESGAFDLAVTSPPYLNNYHYVRNTRPQMWWLNLVDGRDKVSAVETGSMGKYWQTVRDADPIPLDFAHSGIEAMLSKLRATRRAHGPYGGAGWANYAATYFNDTRRWLSLLKKALRPGGVGIVVIGNSIIQGIPVPTDRYLAEIGEQTGLKHEATNLVRATRVGESILNSSVRRGARTGAQTGLYETAVILRRVA
jgi:DNA modification methylase